ncbi:MAG TPA: glutamine-hydrolyzing carbamoyl-phosphate synthase small subunit [Symbiobacteriaceae bacterium]|nr:glutamine-hydrolyzing carbamoyl-phosphate synthase small subunit [Symbiobacteriaceae bacterium]
MKGYLVLEDGSLFIGEGFGAVSAIAGEVVFNTGMTGYQEVLTDPSYFGQIVTMTYPLIGNYGINPADFESRMPWVRGFIVKELCDQPSHWQAVKSLSAYLAENGIPGLAGIDTRALTRHLRSSGTMRGVIVTTLEETAPTPEQLAEWTARAQGFEVHNHVREVTTPNPYRIFGGGHRVVVVDYGLKENILRCLKGRDCDLTVVPSTMSARDILQMRPDGIMLTNGPGDPTDVPESIETVRELVNYGKLPVFGICLGHQILSLALGGSTYKLKYGHRGANHPVKDYITNRVYITSQNHGYAVDELSLNSADIAITHRNLNDNTVEGVMHLHKPVFSVQYHPEAAPGPEESRYLFDRFMGMMDVVAPVKLLA